MLWPFLSSRTSHEVRGLKPWRNPPRPGLPGRTSHEVRGLKPSTGRNSCTIGSRTSHEVRGLKLVLRAGMVRMGTSHLTRGAWIETLTVWQ